MIRLRSRPVPRSETETTKRRRKARRSNLALNASTLDDDTTSSLTTPSQTLTAEVAASTEEDLHSTLQLELYDKLVRRIADLEAEHDALWATIRSRKENPPQKQSRPPSRLQTLPVEIRHKIYSYYFGSRDFIVELDPRSHPLDPLPAIKVLVAQNENKPCRQSEDQASLLNTCHFFQDDACEHYKDIRNLNIANMYDGSSLRRSKYGPKWNVLRYLLFRQLKLQHEIQRVGQALSLTTVQGIDTSVKSAAESSGQHKQKENQRRGEMISAFQYERQASYSRNQELPSLLLSELVPRKFLMHIRSITGLHLKDLSDQYLQDIPQHGSKEYCWLRPDELPCLQFVGSERRAVKWEQRDVGNQDYDDVVARLCTDERNAREVDKYRWDEARVHWENHPTIQFVTKFYAEYHEGLWNNFLTPVNIDYRARSVKWRLDITFDFPQRMKDEYWVNNLWFSSHQVRLL